VELDVVDTDLALLWLGGLWWVWLDDDDLSRTTALGVLDNGTVLLARRLVLTDRPVWHGVAELEFAVELHGDLQLSDGELLDVGGLDPWALGLDIGSVTSNAPLVEGSWEESIAAEETAEGVLDLPSRELAAVVVVDWTWGAVMPIVTWLLTWNTDLGKLDWALESRGQEPAGGQGTLKGRSQSDNSREGLSLHDEDL
jgi:hypothetical protein